MNVLIVDDDPTSLKLLGAQLESEGHAVFGAHDGADALALLERQRVDGVISDILMPRMDGYRLCYEIRKHARLHDLPIIIYTSTYTSPSDEKLALDLGANKYLLKPASVETIIAALHEVIAMPHAAPQPKALPEVEVLKEYNEKLVSKLKGKNTELMAAEGKFRALVEQSIVGIYIAQDDQFVYVNPGMLGISGRSEEEMTSRTIYDFIVPEDRALARENIHHRISGGVPSTRYVLRVLHQSGAVLQVEVHSSLTDYNGRPAVMGMLVDITERRVSEANLRRSETELKEAQRIARIGSWEWVISTDKITWSEELYGIVGFDPSVPSPGFDGMPRFYVPEDWERLRAAVERTLQTGAPYELDLQMIHADGTIIWTTTRGEAVRDQGGTLVSLRGTVLDITERKRAEESLRLQSAALNAAADAIIITDRAGGVEWFNPAFTQLTGYTAEEAIGKNLRDLVKSGKHGQAFYKDLWDTILAGRPWHGEIINRRKDGSLYTEEQVVTPIPDASGAITHFIAIKEDITERLQLEAQYRQSQKMEAIGQLAGGVAHDFNNLLTVIMGNTDLLLSDTSANDPKRGPLTDVRTAAERAADLTRQLLAFSRKQILEPKLVDVHEVVSGIEKMLRRLIGEDVELATDLAADPSWVKVDPSQLEQVVMNLAMNARDAMPRGGRLTIRTRTLDPGEPVDLEETASPKVAISISDTGTGIPLEVKTHLFEPFFTTKGIGKGTGLGLATVFGIVKQSGGDITVESEPGEGATFTVILPSQPAPRQRGDSGASLRAVPRGTETVLAVEDEDAVRRIVKIALESAGYRVIEARNGPEALEVVRRHAGAIHLVVTDVVMPEMSGRELAERIVKDHPGVRILYMSGYMDDAVMRHGIVESGVAFLQKPFTPLALARKVREVLDGKAV
jgi:two-component system cell cycle sensor histidine kinase/response regulator CckA